MRIFDISLPISNNLPVWPGDPPINIQAMNSMNKGDSNNSSFLSMGVHAGTHLDAPHHFLNNNITVDKISLDILIGRAFVVEILENIGVITESILEEKCIPSNIDRLIIKTLNSNLWEEEETAFNKSFIALDNSGAEWLVNQKIKLIGVDYLSVAPYKKGGPTHTTLLNAGMVIVEGLNLSNITEGMYDLICLPLKIMDSDGAPARVVLRDTTN